MSTAEQFANALKQKAQALNSNREIECTAIRERIIKEINQEPKKTSFVFSVFEDTRDYWAIVVDEINQTPDWSATIKDNNSIYSPTCVVMTLL